MADIIKPRRGTAASLVAAASASQLNAFEILALTDTGQLGVALATNAYALMQPAHDNLTALAGLAGAANRVPYFTGAGAMALKPVDTSGDAIPLLNAANTWSANQTFTGNVGIDVTPATYPHKVQLLAGNYGFNQSQNGYALRFNNTDSAAGFLGGFFGSIDGGGIPTIGLYAPNEATAGANTAQPVIVQQSAGAFAHTIIYAANAERMRVSASGNVGIGTSAPDKTLEVNIGTSGALRLTYNDADGAAANRVDLAPNAAGQLVISPSAGALTGVLRADAGVLAVDADAQKAADAVNADGGFTFATTATTIDVAGNFGGTWETAHRFYSSNTATFTGSRATKAVLRQVTGSGANGPSNADYALHVEAWKTNYLTSAVLGEVDGMNVVVRQGSEGDASGILVNIHSVEDTVYGHTGVEVAAAIVDSSGVKQREIKAVVASNTPAADLRGGGFGFMTRPNGTGYTIATGLAILGYSSVASTGFTTAIVASSTLASADKYFEVTGDEHADGSGRVRASAGSSSFPAFSFVGDTNTGMTNIGTDQIGFYGGGVLRLALGPGARFGTGLTDPGAGSVNVGGVYQMDDVTIIDASRGFVLRSYAATTLADAAHAVNTTDKAAGKCVWDATNNRVLTAGGSGTTANWYVANGTVAITPA